MKKLFIIDGHSIAYRAYFALPNTMKTQTGLSSNAIYGFTSMLLNIILNEKPDYIAVTFDRKEPTFRHTMYTEYKAHRPIPDKEFIEQLPVIKKMVDTLAIKHFEIAGYEADDIIGTIALKAEKHGIATVIVTGDLDALQLVTDDISVLTTKRGISDTILYNPEEVKNRFRLAPSQIVDLKGLKGDPSDNIPGVPGIGEKTATKLLLEFGSIENIINHLNEVTPPTLQDKIKNNIDLARLSYQLAKINTEVPLDIDINSLSTKINWKETKLFFQELQFATLISKIPSESHQTNSAPQSNHIKGNYRVLLLNEELNELRDTLVNINEFSFDFETTSTNTMEADIVGVSFCWKEGEASYIPFPQKHVGTIQQDLFSSPEKNYSPLSSGLEKTKILEFLNAIFDNPNSIKIGQNIKFDINILKNAGVSVKGFLFDTMLADYLLEPTRTFHNLKFLSQHYFNITMTPITELIGTGKKQITLAQVPIEKVAQYCCADADMTLRLKTLLASKLQESDLFSYYKDFEEPLIHILSDMEVTGIKLNLDYLSTLAKELSGKIKKEEENIYILAGEHFNINSPQQLGDILFRKLGLPPVKKTRTGISTDIEVLEILAQNYEIAQNLIVYRQLSKLKNTYVDTLPQLINRKTKNIHTTFNQAITATGRLSSSNPNLQNIPIKTEIGSKIRTAFIPSNPNNYLVSVDYSQMELRILAELSKDPLLTESFMQGEDVHTATAAILNEIQAELVTDEMRRKAKVINFGIIYGMSSKGLADSLHISYSEANQFISHYFAKYIGIKNYIDRTIEEATKSGVVKTYFGHIRHIPELNLPNQQRKKAANRIAVNTGIQGTAADIMKLKMSSISKIINSLPFYARMLLQVHDELVFEVDKNHINEFNELINKEMQVIPGFTIPFPVSIAYGTNWKEAK